MATTKQVLKNSGIYGVVSILQKAIGFFLLPLYTSFLTPDDYGKVAVVTSIISFLSLFYLLSLNGAITRFFYEYKDDENKIKEFWGTNVLFIIINSFLLSAILCIFNKYLLMPLAKGINFYPYLLLGIVSITLNPIYSIFQATLQARQIGKQFAINNLIYFICNVIFTIVFVTLLKLKAEGVLFAYALTDTIFFIYTCIKFIPKIKLAINKKYLVESLKYSLPLLPHSLSGWVMGMLDRIFINNLNSTATVGIYNIGLQFGNIINILTTAVNQAYVPWFFEKMGGEKEGKLKVIRFAELAVVIYSFIALIISLFGVDILKFMVSKNFRDGWKVIPFLSFAYVFNGIYYFAVNPLFYNKKGTKYVPIGTFTGAILNTILNFILVPKYNMIGASLASMISMIVASLLVFYISYKIEPLDFRYIKMYVTAFVFFAVSLFPFIKVSINYYIIFAIKTILIIFVLIYLSTSYKEEYKKLKISIYEFLKSGKDKINSTIK